MFSKMSPLGSVLARSIPVHSGHREPTTIVAETFDALKAHSVSVPGNAAAELVVPQLAENIKALK